MNLPDTIAFQDGRLIAEGSRAEVALAVKRLGPEASRILVLDGRSAASIEFDLRGEEADVLARLAEPEPPRRGPGRPKLGVVAREVTLLPRHWEWLADQPGGASVALRRLIDEARRDHRDAQRQARDSLYRFINLAAGNQPGFEEACRALFAGDAARFETQIAGWPRDLAHHARRLARPAFGDA
ncbi:hypothetical protein QO010_003690 [Caulobacter ginsengisoli]|uniref:DUF2239 domain-containing protein n=1 Tax=Caulobacter ginsengisoli TaxID=400775 RepID=A0ABU0IXH8_9CAUL|nr:DUF2239 family protein [Caulobacter ginsengisoli]MDQ0465898.1 hypothetical protein [Caulobacter ginsengisoli]